MVIQPYRIGRFFLNIGIYVNRKKYFKVLLKLLDLYPYNLWKHPVLFQIMIYGEWWFNLCGSIS